MKKRYFRILLTLTVMILLTVYGVSGILKVSGWENGTVEAYTALVADEHSENPAEDTSNKEDAFNNDDDVSNDDASNNDETIMPELPDGECQAAEPAATEIAPAENISEYSEHDEMYFLASSENVIYGDIDGDSGVNIVDAVLALRSIVGVAQLNAQQHKAADVDGNGEVNVNDAILILRFIVGIIGEFPVEGGEGDNGNQEPKFFPDHRIRNRLLYGLDFRKHEVLIGQVPDFLPDGDYQVKNDYQFYQIIHNGQELQHRGTFFYLDLVPYAILPLDWEAGPQVTASFLQQRVVAIRADSPFRTMGEAFMNAQETWGVNALFLMSLAALESAWGTSRIAIDKNNLFGYRAFDDDPYYHAGTFRSMEESVFYVSSFIRRQYLDENGSFARGNNLDGMNRSYATDPMWKIKIARVMERILPFGEYTAVPREYKRGRVNVLTVLNLRSGPGTDFDVTDQLPNGEILSIRGMRIRGGHSWLRVITSSQKTGWVCGSFVGLIDPVVGRAHIRDWYRTDIEGIQDSEVLVRAGPGTNFEALPAGKGLRFADKVTIYELRIVGNHVWYRIANPGESHFAENWVRHDNIIVKW